MSGSRNSAIGDQQSGETAAEAFGSCAHSASGPTDQNGASKFRAMNEEQSGGFVARSCFPDDDGFQEHTQLSQIRYVDSPRATTTSLDENYVGLETVVRTTRRW